VDDAFGAMLLFTTNFAAIVVAACVVFALAGAAPSREMMRERHRVRNGMLVAAVALIVISIPLAVTSFDRAFAIVRSTQGAPVVRDWIGGRDLVVDDWSIDGYQVTLHLSGADAPGDPDELARQLAAVFGQHVDVVVDYIPVSTQSGVGDP